MEGRILSQFQLHMLMNGMARARPSRRAKSKAISAKKPQREPCKEREDGISYLGDDVPVRCLYVTGLQQSSGLKQTLIKYFQAADGPVENVKIKLHKNDPNKCFALVTLADYKNASSALKNEKRVIQHNTRTFHVLVKPADSWHQPKFVKPPEIPHVYDPDEPSIDVLNDDCLLLIFAKLSIFELSNLCGVSDRWDDLLEIITRTQFTELHLDQIFPPKFPNTGESRMSSATAIKIIKLAGPAVKKLVADSCDFHEGEQKILKAIGDYCTELESLEIDGFELDGKKPYMKEIFKRLRSFRSTSENSYDDFDIQPAFEVAENLRELSIDENSSLEGTALCKLKDLIKLNLNSCEYIEPVPLAKGLKSWGETLTTLSLKQCDLIDNNVINVIVNDLKVLEKLTISNHYRKVTNLEDLANCQHLKKLKVEFHNLSSVDPLLEAFSKRNQLERLDYYGAAAQHGSTIEHISKMTSLKHLELAYNTILRDEDMNALGNLTNLEHLSIPATPVSAASILKCVQACPNLTFIDVSQTSVDDEFVYQMLDYMIKSPSRPQLVLVLFETKTDEDKLNESDVFKQNTERLKLDYMPHSLEPDQFLYGYSAGSGEDFDSDYDFDDDIDPLDFDVNEQWGYWDSDSDKYMYGWGRYDSTPNESDLEDFY